MKTVRVSVAFLVMAGAAPGHAAPKPVPPDTPATEAAPSRSASPADAAPAAGASGFAALPEAQRRAIQDALVWTGDFTGVTSGVFGPRTREAIAAYNKRLGSSSDTLDEGARARLLATADRLRKAVGFAPVTDARAGGLRLSLPLKLLSKQIGTDAGTRWSAPDGAAVVDTLAKPAGEGDLAQTFERMSTPGPTRTVTYKLLRPDFFVVAGETGERKFYARFAAGKVDGLAALRGFTFSYPKASAKALDPLVLATAGSFLPFPADAGAPPVTAANPPSSPPPKAPPSNPARLPAQNAGPVFGEGVRVAPRTVLTGLSAADCPHAIVEGAAAVWTKEDRGGGLAVLVAAGAEGSTLAVTSRPLDDGEAMFALFHGESRPGAALLAAPADVHVTNAGAASTAAVSTPLQNKASGAVLIDRSGALAGLTKPEAAPSVSVAGTLLQTRYRLVGAPRIAAFLREAGVETLPAPPSAGTMSFAEAAVAAGPALVRIACSGKAAGPAP